MRDGRGGGGGGGRGGEGEGGADVIAILTGQVKPARYLEEICCRGRIRASQSGTGARGRWKKKRSGETTVSLYHRKWRQRRSANTCERGLIARESLHSRLKMPCSWSFMTVHGRLERRYASEAMAGRYIPRGSAISIPANYRKSQCEQYYVDYPFTATHTWATNMLFGQMQNEPCADS